MHRAPRTYIRGAFCLVAVVTTGIVLAALIVTVAAVYAVAFLILAPMMQ